MTSNKVFLVGLMGVGKTTIGRMLATELAVEFRDSDKEIEERSGVDIPWIFDKEGESGFRERETSTLRYLCDRPEKLLIATGGGIVVRSENRALLKQHGKVVYLHAPLDELVRRTSRDNKRPLLKTSSGNEESVNQQRRAILANLILEREPLYQEVATFSINTLHLSPKQVTQQILRQLS